ncbi:glycerate kinase [Rhodococcus sp. ZPP]|uniref:glycerate kinase n=1 Tax=Rhodococcus sp. ZPP TaxID=2749906 RepID=UPI001AD8608B|nr:glycerate kinase [Rhodococcus sp. ZPP]QTJ66848.1 glycerate kinase [Rhodococcus sp. ZPP]
MRVLVAPDKFKGSLSASDVAACVAEGLVTAGIDCALLPLADGGDGSVDAAVAAGFSRHPVTVAGATGTPHYGSIAVGDDTGTVVVEVADTCGMATLPGGRQVPRDASSLGFGQAIGQALRHSPRRLVLALGGSASTDGGMGMLAALGYIFYDAEGRQLGACGRTLSQVHTVDSSRAMNLTGIELVVAGDVTNPLTGPEGAAEVYGPQKGADPETVLLLDAGLGNLVEAFARSGHPHATSVADRPGAGSAGGIGFAAMILGAGLVSGAEFFLNLLDFDSHLGGVDLVVTGEGCIDDQTRHGKLLTVLTDRARPVPVVAVAGRSTLLREKWKSAGFEQIHVLSDYTDRDTATDSQLTAQLLTHIGRAIGDDAARLRHRKMPPLQHDDSRRRASEARMSS